MGGLVLWVGVSGRRLECHPVPCPDPKVRGCCRISAAPAPAPTASAETSCPARCLGVSRATLILRPQPHHSLGSWGVFTGGRRMGRVWEQPWLESERSGSDPEGAYPKVRLGAISPADVSTPVWARGHTHVPRVYCKLPAVEERTWGTTRLQFSTCSGRNLRLGLAGEQAGRGTGEAGKTAGSQAGARCPGWGQADGQVPPWPGAWAHLCWPRLATSPRASGASSPGSWMRTRPWTIFWNSEGGPWDWHLALAWLVSWAQVASVPSPSHSALRLGLVPHQSGKGVDRPWKSGGSDWQEGQTGRRGTGMMPPRLAWCSGRQHTRGPCS